MRQSATLAADGQSTAFQVIRRDSADAYEGSVFVFGTFGSGTIVLQVSPDGGTTYYTVKDTGNNAITATTASYFNFRLAGDSGSIGNNLLLRFSLSGSTNPALTGILVDNR